MSYPSQDDSLTFDQLRGANDERCKVSFPQCEDWTAADWMVALVGEVGEAANLLKKIRRGDVLPDGRNQLAQELADVQTYLDLLASSLDIDLGEMTRTKFNIVSERVNSDVRL